MFGYVKPCKPQLRVCEFDTYKAIYCGQCKQLGREYGAISRLTLNYDFTFLALLHMSLAEEPSAFSSFRCMLHPTQKKSCAVACEPLSFSSGVGMLMLYFKILDNTHDGGWKDRLTAMFTMPFVKHAYRKAADRYPAVAQILHETISHQSALEEDNCDNVDLACEPTAQALSGICALLSDNCAQQRVLSRFGYLLGRYIYMVDALDDLEQDLRQKSYNPFLLRARLSDPSPADLDLLRIEAKGSIYLTIGELEKTYELLDLHHYRPILDNIVYLGMHDTIQQILLPREEK